MMDEWPELLNFCRNRNALPIEKDPTESMELAWQLFFCSNGCKQEKTHCRIHIEFLKE